MLVNDLEDVKFIRSSGLGKLCGGMGTRGKAGNSSESVSTSSIGKNSGITDGEDSTDSTGEVESPYKGGLDAMEALEEVLPIRRGISRFYNGKSKSFASLAHAVSIQELAKTENAYTRRRRNLLANSLNWNKNRSTASSPLRSNGRISKKTLTKLTRTNMALGVIMTATSSEPENNTATCDNYESDMDMISPIFSPLRKPKPLVNGLSCIHRDMKNLRSLSLADLQCASTTPTSTGTPNTPRSAFGSTISEENRSPL